MAERYQSRHAAEPTAAEKSKLPLMIIGLILCFCILGAGVWALVHFVLLPTPEPTEPPTIAEPTAAPTEPPTEAPTETDYAAMAEAKLAEMTDREKICQLFIVSPEVLTGVDGVTMAGETTQKAIEEYPVGGIVYFSDNLEDKDQTKEMISKSQEYASIPMFIAVDEEGGSVARVAEKLGTNSFDSMYSYREQGEAVAHDNAEKIAADISSLGFNLDFAPVADVWSNPDNSVIGERAYSDNCEEAAKLVKAAVTGFSDGGVLSTVKHFPGHGDASADTHESSAHVAASEEDLKSGELLPFKSGIEAGADMVMAGHIIIDSIDADYPATLSSKVVPQLLREYLGYDGVVITDSMQMAAITDNYSHETIIKGIFEADIDMILLPDNLDQYIEAIQNALENGEITQEQIDAKVKRILTLKYSKGIIPEASEAPTDNPEDTAPTETAYVIIETTSVSDPE